MSNISFSKTEYEVHNDRNEALTFRAGEVVRLFATDKVESWRDCLILGFGYESRSGDCYVKLARPYAYVSCAGTSGPSVLTGVEEIEILAKRLANSTVERCNPSHSFPGTYHTFLK